jgi:uncharacterized protein YcgI (DUF1989 family)
VSRLNDIVVVFTSQQLGLVDRHVAAEARFAERLDLVRTAIREAAPTAMVRRRPPSTAAKDSRSVVEEHTIEPGTGKAFEVRSGRVVRVSQTVGGQCADFNAFNLNNRHEQMHVGRTRAFHGNNPTAGDFVWSKAPWERPMLAFLANTGQTDTQFAPCSAQLYYRFYGDRHHTNCQQIQTEAQREYGLEAHEVHESLNLFMYCSYDDPDDVHVTSNLATKDDFIEFYAVQDVLTVFNVCGDDFDKTNNFELSPLRVTVFESDEDDRRLVDDFAATDHGYPLLDSPYPQVDVPLVRDPIYVAAFPHAPVTSERVIFGLSDAEIDALRRVADADLYGDDLAAGLRDIIVSWAQQRPRVV